MYKKALSSIISLLLIGLATNAFSQTPITDLPKIPLNELNDLVKQVSDGYLKSLTDGTVVDVNNDGTQDIFLIVELNGHSVDNISNLKHAKALKITYLCEDGNNCSDEIELSTPGFFVIHGSNSDWEPKTISNFKASSSVLFRGRTNILAFQRDRLKIEGANIIVERDKKKIRLELGTEASELYLMCKKAKCNWYQTMP